MPRPGPDGPGTRRVPVGIRLSPAEVADLDARALAEGLTIRNGEPNRSELIRLDLAYAAAHRPKGWRPK